MSGRGDRRENLAITDVGLAALATASGVTDATAFLTLGDVFTSAMTGNTALLGIALSQGRILPAAHHVSALLGFIIGASLGAAIYLQNSSNRPGSLEGVRLLLLTEIVFLGAFATILTLIVRPGEDLLLYALILLSAIGMGVQGIAARHINSPGINTIVFTSTLVNIVMSLIGTLLSQSGSRQIRFDTKRQIWIFFAYAFGSMLAGLLAGPALRVAAWIPMLAVLVALGCCERAAKAARRAS